MKKPNLKDLTLREKIAQTAVLRSNFLASTGDFDGYLKNNPYGSLWTTGNLDFDAENMADETNGVINYNNDIENREYNNHLVDIMKVPLIGAMDAERGCGKAFSFFSQTTSNTGIGAASDKKAAYDIAKAIAREMKLCGVRWNWGPVIDNPSPFCAVSLTRTFSPDPEEIKALTVEYIKGVQSEGVVATAKHFPGSDRDEYRDSHFSDYYIRQTYDEWYERQGCVFQAAIDAGVYSIMVGHTIFPALDDTIVDGRYLPATISKKMITDILKNKMGFKGVVVTDAVGMRSVTARFDDPEDFYAAFYNAGCDVILGPNHPDFVDIVESAIANGKISEERIDDACQRVLDMKEKIGLFSEPKIEATAEDRVAARENCKRTTVKYAPKSITWVSRENDLVPIKQDKIKKVQIVYIGYSDDVLENIKNYVVPEFEKRGAKVNICEQIEDKAHIQKIADENDLILYFAHIAPHSPFGVGGFIQKKATQFLYVLTEGAKKSICVSTGSPFVYNDWFPSAENFLNLYCACPEYMQALVEGIYGECDFTGICPYDNDPLAPRL